MSQTLNRHHNTLFRRVSLTTLVAVYLLILVGGIVRSTGSGMGCPDWPKCFGSWVPPTDVSQLPADYKDVYAQQRADKNERLLALAESLGFNRIAERVRGDESILVEADFNSLKTWTEYINRLIGAVIGLLIFATFLYSTKYWKLDQSITITAFAAFILVGFQGWVGSIVVSTNLLPGIITFHMLLAMIIVGLLVYVVFRSYQRSDADGGETTSSGRIRLNGIVVLLLILTLTQILVGTQVRESVDMVAKELGNNNRDQWIEALGGIFTLHRSMSFLVMALHIWVVAEIYQRFGWQQKLTRWGLVLIIIIGLEVFTGAIMAFFGVPRFAQPVHLLLATIAFGIQLFMLLELNATKSVRKDRKEYASY